MKLLGGIAGIVVAVGLAGCGSSHRSVLDSIFFRPVDCTIPTFSGEPAESSTTPSAATSEAACHSANPKSVPSTPPGGETAAATVILPYFYNSQRFVLGPADLDGSSVARTSVVKGEGTGYEVQTALTAAGAEEFNRIANERFTTSQDGSKSGEAEEALDVNGVVVSTTAFQARSYNGIVIVAGPATAPFSKAQAQALAERIEQAAPRA